MKILMLSDVYFPRVNGVSTSIQTFRRELAALGHEADLIAPAYPPGTAGDDGGCVRVPSRGVALDPEDRMMRLRAVLALLPQLAQKRYDLIHIQTPFVAHHAGIRLADALGVPRLETYHTFFEEYLFHYVPILPRSWLRALSRRISRRQCNRMDALIVPSSAMRDRLADYGVHVPMHLVPTGVAPADFSAGDGAAFRSEHGIAPDRPMLLYVGRVAHEKNIPFLIRAFERARSEIPSLMLTIAGEGPALASLKKVVAARNLRSHTLFVGYLDRRGALLDCYRSATAFVFASRTETQGLVLLEAMALGVPVISTAVMGTRDVVGPRRGALVPDDNEADFARAILTLMRDAQLRARLAQEGRAYASEWSAAALARRLADVYQETIAAGTRAAQKHARTRAAAATLQ